MKQTLSAVGLNHAHASAFEEDLYSTVHNFESSGLKLGALLADTRLTPLQASLILSHQNAHNIPSSSIDAAVAMTQDRDMLTVLAYGVSRLYRNNLMEQPAQVLQLTAHLLIHHAPLPILSDLLRWITATSPLSVATVRSIMDKATEVYNQNRADIFYNAVAQTTSSHLLYPYGTVGQLRGLLRNTSAATEPLYYRDALHEAHRLGKREHIAILTRHVFQKKLFCYGVGRKVFLPFVPTNQVNRLFELRDSEEDIMHALKEGERYHPDDYPAFAGAVLAIKIETGYVNESSEAVLTHAFDHLPPSFIKTMDYEDWEAVEHVDTIQKQLVRLTEEKKTTRRDAIVNAIMTDPINGLHEEAALPYIPTKTIIAKLSDHWDEYEDIIEMSRNKHDTAENQTVRKTQILDAICAGAKEENLLGKHIFAIFHHGYEEHFSHLTSDHVAAARIHWVIPDLARHGDHARIDAIIQLEAKQEKPRDCSDLRALVNYVTIPQLALLLRYDAISPKDLHDIAFEALRNRDHSKADFILKLADERMAALPEDRQQSERNTILNYISAALGNLKYSAAAIDLSRKNNPNHLSAMVKEFLAPTYRQDPDSMYRMFILADMPAHITRTIVTPAWTKAIARIHDLRTRFNLKTEQVGDVLSTDILRQWKGHLSGLIKFPPIVAIIGNFLSGRDRKHLQMSLTAIAPSPTPASPPVEVSTEMTDGHTAPSSGRWRAKSRLTIEVLDDKNAPAEKRGRSEEQSPASAISPTSVKKSKTDQLRFLG